MLGEIAPAPLFQVAFFYLSWLWLPFLLALRCLLLSCASVLLSLFVFLLPGVFLHLFLWSVSGLLHYRALLCTSLYRLGSSSMLPVFPFGLWVLFCLGRSSGPSATGSAPSRSLSRACLLAPQGWSSSPSLLLLVLSSFPSSSGSFLLGGSVLLLFPGFSRLWFGLCAFFVLLWFSLAVFRVGPSPDLSWVTSSVSLEQGTKRQY